MRVFPRRANGHAGVSDVEVRGCCCGIPFGCGSVLLLLSGFCLWPFVKAVCGAAVGVAAAALTTGAAAVRALTG